MPHAEAVILDATGFRHLATCPELSRPLHALQAPPVGQADQMSAGQRSVEALAARYLAAVRTMAPTGPYLLVGWAWVAW